MPQFPTQPIPNAETKPFWDGCAQEQFLLQRCASCNAYRHPPSPTCSRCLSDRFDWLPAKGTGTVYSFTVVREQSAPGWSELVPYVLTVVELDEGPHVLTNLVNVEPEAVRIGMPVEVTFAALSDTMKLPVFRPAARA
jgi:uncharacterized OB-fold protein